MIAPLIINLCTEVSKINEILPKVLDIKTEVSNTADAVRQIHVEMTDVKAMFKSAVDGIKAEFSEITDEDISVCGDLRTFRRSLNALEEAPAFELHPLSQQVSDGATPNEIPGDDTLQDLRGFTNDGGSDSEVNTRTENNVTLKVTDLSNAAVGKIGNAKESRVDRYSDIVKRKSNVNVHRAGTDSTKMQNEALVRGEGGGGGGWLCQLAVEG